MSEEVISHGSKYFIESGEHDFHIQKEPMKNDWWVYSTAIAEGVLMLQCKVTGAKGIVTNPSEEEWNEAYHAPSKPYHWTGGEDRVEKG